MTPDEITPITALRGQRMNQAGAVAATAAFAGGGLLTQTVIVPLWRAMDPPTFQRSFKRAGPATGATLFPLEVTSVVLLASAVRSAGGNWRWWAAACGFMVGTVALLPAYFAPANRALLNDDFPPEEVPDELATWNRWNWFRTGLSLLATALSGVALATGEE